MPTDAGHADKLRRAFEAARKASRARARVDLEKKEKFAYIPPRGDGGSENELRKVQEASRFLIVNGSRMFSW